MVQAAFEKVKLIFMETVVAEFYKRESIKATEFDMKMNIYARINIHFATKREKNIKLR